LYTYDDADRLIQVDRATGATPAYVTTTTAWDDEGRVQSQCDNAGDCTTTTYVAGTQLPVVVTPPASAHQPTQTSTRNAAGLVTKMSYTSGTSTLRTLFMSYDALNRLCSVDIAAATGCPSSNPSSVAAASSQQGMGATHQDVVYDDLGRILLATDNGVSNLAASSSNPDVTSGMADLRATQSYDTMGHTLSEVQTWNQGAAAAPVTPLRTSYTVDGVGNVLTIQYPLPSTAVSTSTRLVTQTFDANERLARVLDNKGATASMSPASLIMQSTFEGSRVKQKDFGGPSGSFAPVASTRITYDSMQRPGTITQNRVVAGTPSALATLTTKYDAAGNRLAQKLQGVSSATPNDAFSQLFAYDALNRAVSWKQGKLDLSVTPPTVTAGNTQSWTLDGTNQWNSWTKSATTCTRATATPTGGAARALSETCGASTTTYQWDALGNLVDDNVHHYKWDAFNRLIRVEDKSGNLVVGYAYDAFGRRVTKMFPTRVGGSQLNENSLYAFSGQHVIQEDQLRGGTVVPPSLTAPPLYRVVRQWAYGSGIDEVLAMDWDKDGDQSAIGPADARYYYAYDSAGNVLGLYGSDGHLQEGYAYDAYGNPSVLCTTTSGADLKWDQTDAYGSFDPATRQATCGAATTNPPFGYGIWRRERVENGPRMVTRNGAKYDWFETLDATGRIRQVRPHLPSSPDLKVHYMYDEGGGFIGLR
jgi:YD repeat-containing protein